MADQKKGSTKKKKIAVLGWGSLIWDTTANQEFDRLHGKWMSDGPVLNLEFPRKSKKSRAGALTLVIDPKHGVPCTVAYALSTRSDSAEAREDLCRPEGTSAERIGLFLANTPANCPLSQQCACLKDGPGDERNPVLLYIYALSS